MARNPVVLRNGLSAGFHKISFVIWIASQSASDSSVLFTAIALALIPLGLVLTVVFWIDRWEPEPLPTLVVAFLWGAGVATAISMLVNSTVLYAAADSTLKIGRAHV